MEEYRFSVPEFLTQTEVPCNIENIEDFIKKAKCNFENIEFGSGLDEYSLTKYFRGQSNANYGLKSNIYRFIENDLVNKNDIQAINQSIEKREEKIFNIAEEIGIGRNMTFLEKLASMQHHGVPTRLLDITDEALVALYFACEKDHDKDGRVFIFLADPKSENGKEIRLDEITQEQKDGEQVPEFIRSKTSRIIRTNTIDPRIIAQKGLFISGNITVPKYMYNPNGAKYKSPNPGGTRRTNLRHDEKLRVNPYEIFFVTHQRKVKRHDIYCKTILIPKNLKSKILKELDNLGVNKKSLFPDFNTLLKLTTEH